jgi:monolysocardiolipin acyltransferase
LSAIASPRLVTDVEKTPVVIPFVHTGMQEMMPIGSKFPSIHKKVTVLVGDPIELDDIINQSSRECLLKEALYDAITVWVDEQMWVIKTEFGELVLTQRSEEMATVE